MGEDTWRDILDALATAVISKFCTDIRFAALIFASLNQLVFTF